MSPNFKKMALNTSFQPVVVKRDKVSGIIDVISNSFDELLSIIAERKTGQRSNFVPVL